MGDLFVKHFGLCLTSWEFLNVHSSTIICSSTWEAAHEDKTQKDRIRQDSRCTHQNELSPTRPTFNITELHYMLSIHLYAFNAWKHQKGGESKKICTTICHERLIIQVKIIIDRFKWGSVLCSVPAVMSNCHHQKWSLQTCNQNRNLIASF